MKRISQRFLAISLTAALLSGSASEGLAAVAASASAAAGRAGMSVGAVGANLGQAGLGSLNFSQNGQALALPAVSNLALPNNAASVAPQNAAASVSGAASLNSAAAVTAGAGFNAAPFSAVQPSAQGRAAAVQSSLGQVQSISASPSAKPAVQALAAASGRAAAVNKAAGDLSAGRIGLGAAVSAGRAMFDRGALSAVEDVFGAPDSNFDAGLDLGKPLSAIFTPVTREQADFVLAGLSGNDRFAGVNAADAAQRSWLAPVVAEIARNGSSIADAAFNAADEAVYKMYALQSAAAAARTRADLSRVVAEMEALELPLGLYVSNETHDAFRAQASGARQRLAALAAQAPRRSGLASAESLAARDAVFAELGREAVPAAAVPAEAPAQGPDRSAATTVKAALAWGLADFGFAFLALILAGLTRHEFTPNYGKGGDIFSIVGPVELLFAGAVVAPIAEEVIFRGFFQGGMSKILSRIWDSPLTRFWIPAVFVSAVFVVIHETGDVFLMGVRFVGAMIMAGVFYRHGFWASALLHGIHNGLAMAAGVFFMIGLPEAAVVMALAWFIAAVYSVISLTRAKLRGQDKRGAALSSTGAFIAAAVSLSGAILTPLSSVTVSVAVVGAVLLGIYGIIKRIQENEPKGPRTPKVAGYQLGGRSPEAIRSQLQRIAPRYAPLSREDHARISELFAELRAAENLPDAVPGSREWRLSVFKTLAAELNPVGQTPLMLAAFLDAGDFARVQEFYRGRSLPHIVARQNFLIRQLYKHPGVRNSAWFRTHTRLGRVLDALDSANRPNSPQVAAVNIALNYANFSERKEKAVKSYFAVIDRLVSAGEVSPYYARLMKDYAYAAAREANLTELAQAEVLKHPMKVPEDFAAELAVGSGKTPSRAGAAGSSLWGLAGLALLPISTPWAVAAGAVFLLIAGGLMAWRWGAAKDAALKEAKESGDRHAEYLLRIMFEEQVYAKFRNLVGVESFRFNYESHYSSDYAKWGRVKIIFKDADSLKAAVAAGVVPEKFKVELPFVNWASREYFSDIELSLKARQPAKLETPPASAMVMDSERPAAPSKWSIAGLIALFSFLTAAPAVVNYQAIQAEVRRQAENEAAGQQAAPILRHHPWR